MKSILLTIAISVSVSANSQVSKVSLQASGLTCSMCSNAINKALKTLDFINKVDANVKNYTFEISFKPNSEVNFDRIKKKVEDAGFFVSSFTADIYFNNILIKESQPVKFDSYSLLFIDQKEQWLSGIKQVKILDKGFVSSKEYKGKTISTSLTDQGIYHATF